jgi:hypothetical protein
MTKERKDPVEERAEIREELPEEQREDSRQEGETPALHGGWSDDAGSPGLKDKG